MTVADLIQLLVTIADPADQIHLEQIHGIDTKPALLVGADRDGKTANTIALYFDQI